MLIATAIRMRYSRAPGLFVGVAASVAMTTALGWKVIEVGRIPIGLPPFIGFAWVPEDVKVLPSAFALAFVASVELLMTSRVVDHFRGHQRPVRDADLELGAYGIANFIGALFAAPTSVGIPARSVANVQCGATTKVSNLVHGALLWAMMTVGATLISRVPVAALAGVTAWMGFRLLDWSAWKRLPKIPPVDAGAFLVTFVTLLISDAVLAISIGCSPYVLRYLLDRSIGVPAWLKPRETGSLTKERAASVTQGR
jgi:sulfate permease, SulP family